MTQQQNLHELGLQLLQSDPAGFDRLVEQYIMLTDLTGMVQQARDVAARSLNYFFKDLQVEVAPYHRDVSAALSALSYMQQARPSTRLEVVVVQQDGCRAQVSFWREIDRGTIIYGSAQHSSMAAAISLAMLSAESKAIQMGCSMRDLRNPKPPAIKAVEDLLRHLRGMALADLPGRIIAGKIREFYGTIEETKESYEKVKPLAEALSHEVRSDKATPGKSLVRENAERDPNYAPYCLRCPDARRMKRVESFYWRCDCGAQHDEREATDAAVAPPPDSDCPPDFDAIDQVIQQAEQTTPETKES
jgi:hypothetical protein